MPGQTDLKKILESIDPYLVDESFIFMTTDPVSYTHLRAHEA